MTCKLIKSGQGQVNRATSRLLGLALSAVTQSFLISAVPVYHTLSIDRTVASQIQ